jgi:thiol-disulfide isomerase/thioredoxin
MPKNRTSEKRSSNRQVMAMVLIGAGLVFLGGLAMILLPRFTAGANAPQESIADYASVTPFEVDFAAPELNLIDLQGEPVALSDYRGQVVLVNNWAFWCPPCRAEMPVLQEYYDAHRHQDFVVIGIEAGDELVDVEYHVDLYKLSFPIWLDLETEALRAFNNPSLPNSYVIDAEGRVRLAWSGPVDRATLEKYVTPLLEK